MYSAVKMDIHWLGNVGKEIVIPLFSCGDPWEETWALCGLVIGLGVETLGDGCLIGG